MNYHHSSVDCCCCHVEWTLRPFGFPFGSKSRRTRLTQSTAAMASSDADAAFLALKAEKEAFVSGFSGAPMWEPSLVVTAFPVRAAQPLALATCADTRPCIALAPSFDGCSGRYFAVPVHLGGGGRVAERLSGKGAFVRVGQCGEHLHRWAAEPLPVRLTRALFVRCSGRRWRVSRWSLGAW